MANRHIEISGNATRFSSNMRSLIDSARSLQALVNKVKDIADQITYNEDWTSFAAYLGLSGDDDPEGKAETVYGLLSNLYTAINDAAVFNNFIDRLG